MDAEIILSHNRERAEFERERRRAYERIAQLEDTQREILHALNHAPRDGESDAYRMAYYENQIKRAMEVLNRGR